MRLWRGDHHPVRPHFFASPGLSIRGMPGEWQIRSSQCFRVAVGPQNDYGLCLIPPVVGGFSLMIGFNHRE